MPEPEPTEPSRRRVTRHDERPVLDEPAGDERAEGWGDSRERDRDDDWYQRERPPHHG